MTEMTPAEAVFFAAAALPAADRVAYLARACAGNDDLRRRVERMLAARPEVGDFLERPPAPPAEGATETFAPDGPPVGAAAPTADYLGRDEHAGAVVGGKYTLVEPIGQGGMGSVWRAKQTEPVKRFVAVKLIKAGMDSKQVLARFEAERQALALMDHPNIAKVLDGGLHESRPFFVMELVKGVPITEYCDANKLTPKERLELFVPVCQAIQHAHQKGIIHRDIKPSNVLIALYDDKPVVKVIDFGVAKATGAALTERTINTGFGGVVGTPEYMSPEQATFNNLDIDTRSDVYALGVLLYELLAGSPPFARKELEKKGLLEMLRVVREEEPPRPSTRLSTAEALPTLSANRGTEPRKLTGLLRNELDWIVMKALEKDRSRRYETANGFAADVLRYLSGEPVVAHPPSAGYRLKKLVRRNRAQVVAAGLVLAALVAGIAGTTLGLIEARRQEVEAKKQEAEARKQEGLARDETLAKEKARAAEAEQREAAEKAAAKEKTAREQTQKRLAQIEKGVELFAGMLAGISPRSEEKDGKHLYEQLRERAEKAADQLQAEAVGDPLAEARLQTVLGDTMRELGSHAKAVAVLERARATRERELGADHPDTLLTLNSLAVAYRYAGRTADALALFERVDAQVQKLGADHPATLTTLNNRAAAYLDAGRTADAIPLLERVRDVLTKKLGADHPATLLTLNNLAAAYLDAGRVAECVELLELVRDGQVQKLGADHSDTLTTLSNLAAAYKNAGRAADAVALHERVRDARVRTLGADHPDTFLTLNNLATAYQDAGRAGDAIPLLERIRDTKVKKLGPDHPDTLNTLNNLAGAYQDTGRIAEAIALFEQVRDASVKKLGADHPDTLTTLINLAAAYWSVRRFDQSIPLFEDVLARQEKKLGRQHPNTLTNVANLGVNYRDAGRLAAAIPLLEEAYRATTKHPSLRWVGPQLLDGYVKAGRAADAARLIDELLADTRKQLPKDSPQLGQQLAQFGLTLLEMKGFDEAEPLLRESLALREKAQPDAWNTFNAQSMLGGALLGQKKYATAEPLLLKGYEGLKAREKTIPPPGLIRIPEALDRLIELYTATDKPEEAKKWRAERAKYPNVAPPPREKK